MASATSATACVPLHRPLPASSSHQTSRHQPVAAPIRQRRVGAAALVRDAEPLSLGRRDAMSLAGMSLGSLLTGPVPPSFAVDSKEVGQYLPEYGKDDLVLFVPGRQETPAIRAATIDPNKPYSFALPRNWKRDPVANISSGNYCQPRCAEPWTEVIFSSPQDGRAQVIISPLVRLINKSGASLDEIGPPEGLIQSFGAYITGTGLEEDEVLSASSKKVNGRTYYNYEIYAPYGTQPPHGLASLTTKGDAAILFVINATDKQWSAAEPKLRAVLDSFVV